MTMTTFEGGLRSLIAELPKRAVRRVDGWVNAVTGLGSALTDKVSATVPQPFYGGLSDQVLTDLFHTDSTVRKAVTKRPDDALRLGVRLSLPKEAGGHEVATAFQDALDDLDAVSVFRDACTWENLYGGAVVYMALDDGQYALDSQAQPVRWDRLRRVLWLRAIDRTRIRPSYELADLDNDETSITYGQPLIYLLDVQLTGVQLRIHRDRLIIFPGALTTDYERRGRGGWGISIIDPVYEVLQRNVTAWQSAGNALANAQYTVYKLRGLASMFSMPDGEVRARKRAQAMEMAKSLVNSILIDADDEYTRENPNFGNMPSMLDQFMLDVSAALDMPATVLWGRSPAGMNATGESDLQLWHASVDAYREHHLRPRLQRLIEALMYSSEGPTGGQMADGWRVYFPPLRQLSEIEKADIRQKTSAADASDIVQGILLPQEVAVSRFRPEGYSTETHVDLDLRERLLKLEIDAREMQLERATEEPEPQPPQPPELTEGAAPGASPQVPEEEPARGVVP
jgi:uncharacterized protein